MECSMCGSKINNGDSICHVCGTSVNSVMQNTNLNNNVNNQYNNMQQMNSSNQMRMPVCCDFVCPHCGVRIPENQLYQFIQRPQINQINSNIGNYPQNNSNLNNNFNNMNGLMNNNVSSVNLYNQGDM